MLKEIPLEISYPDVTLTYHPRDSTKVAVCASCKKPLSCPIYSSIYSFVHSNSPIRKTEISISGPSLGRAVDANAFSEYRCKYKKPTNSQLLSYTNNHDHLTSQPPNHPASPPASLKHNRNNNKIKWSLEYLHHSTRATRPPQTPLTNAAFSAHTTPPKPHTPAKL